MRSIKDLVEDVLSHKYFGPRAPISLHYVPGKGRVLAITGDNASGKSFVGRFLKEILKKFHEIGMIRISMDRRVMGGFERALMYGDESWESTGQLSMNAVMGALNSCDGWDHRHAIYFDEPDVGLSEANQGALGSLLAQKEWPSKTRLVCVATHSRPLIRELASIEPHWLRLGDKMSLEEFLEPPALKTVEDLKALSTVALERFRRISRIIRESKKR